MNEERIHKLINDLNLKSVMKEKLTDKDTITKEDVKEMVRRINLEDVLKKNIIESTPEVNQQQLEGILREESLVNAVLAALNIDISESSEAFENLSIEEMAVLQGAGDIEGEGFIATALLSGGACATLAGTAVSAVVSIFKK
ncbi:lichenicidin A2 family type 2 lantibiotic [Enterococcus sp. RIT-PI-f]|uniref:lichenicidin A2 family type 2 lantibiotic n=1 Tax=Enterococcus sp. RIT-PI-f TaxID=1690244 RepID=UPI0006B8B1F8|nr:lichenicidin A2 family type 2 lantibiotic [Enterococcus sp. RIT-PI-f]KPG69956.1 hypothetical protein AEQ18_11095 [Enterococcus sp. RIT-PI-f]